MTRLSCVKMHNKLLTFDEQTVSCESVLTVLMRHRLIGTKNVQPNVYSISNDTTVQQKKSKSRQEN